MACSSTICYNEFITDLPNRATLAETEYHLVVSNLPTHFSIGKEWVYPFIKVFVSKTADVKLDGN